MYGHYKKMLQTYLYHKNVEKGRRLEQFVIKVLGPYYVVKPHQTEDSGLDLCTTNNLIIAECWNWRSGSYVHHTRFEETLLRLITFNARTKLLVMAGTRLSTDQKLRCKQNNIHIVELPEEEHQDQWEPILIKALAELGVITIVSNKLSNIPSNVILLLNKLLVHAVVLQEFVSVNDSGIRRWLVVFKLVSPSGEALPDNTSDSKQH